MNRLRKIHLYLGCFFAPILVLFIVTGFWQTFGWHEYRKDGYTPPVVVHSLSQVHISQRWDGGQKSSVLFKIFIVAMSLGLLATTILGIIMAFRFTKSWEVWACLLGGIFIPVLFLLFGI